MKAAGVDLATDGALAHTEPIRDVTQRQERIRIAPATRAWNARRERVAHWAQPRAHRELLAGESAAGLGNEMVPMGEKWWTNDSVAGPK